MVPTREIALVVKQADRVWGGGVAAGKPCCSVRGEGGRECGEMQASSDAAAPRGRRPLLPLWMPMRSLALQGTALHCRAERPAWART